MITVKVPATSANCSIGFDSLGLALDWKCAVTFEKSEQLTITGCPEEYCTKDNLVYQAFVLACQAAHVSLPAVAIHIDSEIPFARGLGSSSLCYVAGLCGANALLNLGLNKEELLELANRLEGHPDNAAPAIYGGLCVCVSNGDELIHFSMGAHQWKVLAVIPDYEVSTHEARKVLPQEISLKEATAQVGHALLFEHAWVNEEEEMLLEACHDVLHEPARAKLIPEYQYMKDLASEFRVPFWISGSGSTMAFVSQSEQTLQEIRDRIISLAPAMDCRIMHAADTGAEVIYG